MIVASREPCPPPTAPPSSFLWTFSTMMIEASTIAPIATAMRSEERRVGQRDWSSDVCSSDLFGGLECENGQERDGDDQQSEKDRPPHLLKRVDDRCVPRTLSAADRPALELLVDVLDHDDRGVHHCPDRDRD